MPAITIKVFRVGSPRFAVALYRDIASRWFNFQIVVWEFHLKITKGPLHTNFEPLSIRFDFTYGRKEYGE